MTKAEPGIGRQASVPIYTVQRARAAGPVIDFLKEHRTPGEVDLRKDADIERAVEDRRAYVVTNNTDQISLVVVAWLHLLKGSARNPQQFATEIGSLLCTLPGFGLPQIAMSCLITDCAQENPDFLGGNHPIMSHIYSGNAESENLFAGPESLFRFERARPTEAFMKARKRTIQSQHRPDDPAEFFAFDPKNILKINAYLRTIRTQPFITSSTPQQEGRPSTICLDLDSWEQQSARARTRLQAQAPTRLRA